MNKLITSVWSMKTLAEAVRSRSACIPITNVRGGNALVPDPCFGIIVVDGDDSEIRLRSGPLANEVAMLDSVILHQNANEPIPELQCVLDGILNVTVKNIFRVFGNHSVSHGITNCFGFDSMSATGENSGIEMVGSSLATSKIARSKLHFSNHDLTTTSKCSEEGLLGCTWEPGGLGGDMPPYRYRIMQTGDDIEIVVKLLPDESPVTTESAQEFMDATILCLNWINGGHPYAYFRSQKCGEHIKETVCPLQQIPRCTPRLVRPTFGTNEAAQILECGIRHFCTKSPLAKDLELFLWQYRDATAEGPITLSMLLQGCTLLEGIVGLTLRHSMGLDEKAMNLLRLPGCLPEPKRNSTAKKKFYHTCFHLGFNWDNELDSVFKTWKMVRNALAHGDLAEFERRCPDDIINSYLQVIQAFNAIALRLIGYKGRVKIDNSWYAIPI